MYLCRRLGGSKPWQTSRFVSSKLLLLLLSYVHVYSLFENFSGLCSDWVAWRSHCECRKRLSSVVSRLRIRWCLIWEGFVTVSVLWWFDCCANPISKLCGMCFRFSVKTVVSKGCNTGSPSCGNCLKSKFYFLCVCRIIRVHHEIGLTVTWRTPVCV